MKIRVRVEASQDFDYKTLDFDDLGITKDEFETMDVEERTEAIQKAIDDLEQPCWIVDNYKID